MTKRELIKMLKDIPDCMPVTCVFRDFPTEVLKFSRLRFFGE